MVPSKQRFESHCQTTLEQAGDAVVTIDVSSGAIIYANRWAAKLTRLKAGQLLTSPPKKHDASPPSWLLKMVEQTNCYGYARLGVLWRTPSGSCRNRVKALDVIAARHNMAKPMVTVIMRDVSHDREIALRLWNRDHEINALSRAGQMVNRSLDPHEVAERALESVLEFLSANSGKVYLFEAQRDVLVLAATRGLSETDTVPEVGIQEEFMVARAFREDRVICADSIWDQPPMPPEPCYCSLSFPLRSEGRSLGVIQAAVDKEYELTNADQEFFASFGLQAGAALENALLHKEVKRAAEFDGLTGVHNRQRIEGLLEERFKRGARYGERFAAAMVDIDRFKSFNDVHSHHLGDQVLKKVAGAILKEIRETDHVGRWGGEEFLVVISEVKNINAIYIAERIRKHISAMSICGDDGMEVPITVSIGLACYPDDATTPRSLIRSADQALLYAKRSGRNRVQRYVEAMVAPVPGAAPERFFENDDLNTIKTLAAALDAKDTYTAGHSEGVKTLAISIGTKMLIGNRRLKLLEEAAIMHDIGKVAVPDAFLNKPGALTPEEWAVIREHPRLGVMILKRATQLAPILPIVLHHHEHYDGSGYPEGKKGDSIPLLARILCVADAFSAMIVSRPYRKALRLEEAWKIIIDGKGTRYDPAVVEAFGRVFNLPAQD